MFDTVMMWLCLILIGIIAIGFFICCVLMLMGMIFQRKDKEMVIATLSEDFFVTQAGQFVAPVTVIESLYAPHYRANSAWRGILQSRE